MKAAGDATFLDRVKHAIGAAGTTTEKLGVKTQLHQTIVEYEENTWRKWVVVAVGLLLALVLGIKLPPVWFMATHSKYRREGVEAVMQAKIGGKNFDQILTDELLVVAYDYNNLEPRFYSKYFLQEERAAYNIPIANATAASAAAPTFFYPKVANDRYGMRQTLIDGGLICNNPAMYASMMAKHLLFHKKIRVLSLGTGEKFFDPKKDRTNFNKKDAIAIKDEFMMNMDTYTADNFLNHTLIPD